MEPNSLERTVVTISFMCLAHFGHSTSWVLWGNSFSTPSDLWVLNHQVSAHYHYYSGLITACVLGTWWLVEGLKIWVESGFIWMLRKGEGEQPSCCGLNCMPLKRYDEVFIPSTCEWDPIWKPGLCRYNQVKMKSYPARVRLHPICLVSLEKSRRDTETHEENTMWGQRQRLEWQYGHVASTS